MKSFPYDQFHPALRAIAGVIGSDFGMHPAGVSLCLFLLMLLPTRAIEVNRPYLCTEAHRERDRANEK